MNNRVFIFAAALLAACSEGPQSSGGEVAEVAALRQFMASDAAPDAKWQAFLAGPIEKPDAVPLLAPISAQKSMAMCNEVRTNGRNAIPILAREGLPSTWKNKPKSRGNTVWSHWQTAPNSAGLTGISIHYDQMGKVHLVALSGPSGLAGGIAYWMSPDEECILGVKHSDRAGRPSPPRR